MKSLKVPHCLALAVTTAALATSSYGAVTITTNSNYDDPTTPNNGTPFASTPWAGQLKNNDLINATNGKLATTNPVVFQGGTDPNMPISGVNDGVTNNTYGGGAQSTYINPTGFNQAGNTTAILTFNLNTSLPGYTFGYDITSIESFMGFGHANQLAQSQANQTYTVAARNKVTGNWTDITTVSYKPFTDVVGNNYESYVKIQEDNGTGFLATGVDSIRFTFLKPIDLGDAGTPNGTVIRELDIQGVPEPSAALLGGLGMLALLRRRRA